MNEKPYPDIPNDAKEILPRLTCIDPAHVKFSVDYARTLFRNEFDRNTEVERKAALLVGATGVAVVLFIALAGFLLDFPKWSPGWSKFVLLALFVVLTVAFGGTIFFSLKVLWVGRTARPGVLSILDGQTLDVVEYKKRYVTDLIVSFSINLKETDRRVDQLVRSQRCFLSSLAAMFLIGVTIAAIALLKN